MEKLSKYSRFITRLQGAPYLQDDVVNFIFNNIKNIGLSLLPVVAGRVYIKDPQGDSQALVIFIVFFLAVIALALLGLNILHGWRWLSKQNLPRWLLFPLALIYALAIALVWKFLMDAKS